MAFFMQSVLNRFVLATLLLLATASLVHLDEDVQTRENITHHSFTLAVSTATGYATESLLPVRNLISLELGENAAEPDCKKPCLPVLDTPTISRSVNGSPLDPAAIDQLVSHWTISDYRSIKNRQSQVSAEEAFMMYSYLGQCESVIRSERVHDTETRRLQDMIDNASKNSKALIRQRLEELNQQYHQCNGLASELVLERIEWFTLAADLGYKHAQQTYYQTIPELISQQHLVAFRHPEILTRYRQKAPEYLETGLSADQPETYLLYSRAKLDGIVVPADAIDAYAYAFVAMMLDEKRSGHLKLELEAIESVLDRSELDAARKRGRTLLNRA